VFSFKNIYSVKRFLKLRLNYIVPSFNKCCHVTGNVKKQSVNETNKTTDDYDYFYLTHWIIVSSFDYQDDDRMRDIVHMCCSF